MTAPDPASELYVVANRLPVSWSERDGWSRAPGGLVTALEAFVRRRHVGWFGSSAAVGADGTLPSWPYGDLHAVPVSPELGDRAVGGMANSTLWPALHGFADEVRWHERWWDAFIALNEQFADAIARTAAPGATVWAHDFHLFLLPMSLAARRRDLTVGLSIHTPFDAPGVASLPVADQLLDALGWATLIGVQTAADRDALAGALGPRGEARVVVSPVSIDPEGLDIAASAPAGRLLLDRLGVGRGTRSLVVGVDRIDHTKGIVERLIAFDRAFRRRIVDPETVEFVQVAQPSRTGLTQYRDLGIEIERLAHQIGSDWLRADGTPPVRVITESLDRRLVTSLLAAADVALVTPRRDGMNLVAKEFSIVNESRAGVLVLSSGAGAVAELGEGSVVVDGADPESVVGGLHRALTLDDQQRRRLAAFRAARVRRWTAADWSTHFFEELARRRRPHEPAVSPPESAGNPLQ